MAPTSEKSTTLELTTPVQFLKGCGAARAARLARLGVHTARDLLFLFPRDYQDLTELRTVADLEEGEPACLLAQVEEVELRDRPGGRSVLGVLLGQPAGHLRALWFNLPFMREKFHAGQMLRVAGKPRQRGGRWEMAHPQVQIVESESEIVGGQLLPLYPLTEGLHQRHVRQLVRTALDALTDRVEETFPQSYLDEHNLWPIQTALAQIHFPANRDNLEQARRRLIYQELLVLQLALALKRQQIEQHFKALPMPVTSKIDARIRRLLPFTLTPGQDRVIAEIAADMAREHPMNRLLQGDVGAGKTVVAAYAMLLAVAHGAQAALMAPTEILARQHARTLAQLLERSQVRQTLLTGGLTARARADALAAIASGEAQVVVGTQAFVESDVEFARLGLVVIDEQHKFGVRQRATMKRSPVRPHYLVMTATPIPRTISMTLFGDLDASVLSDSPPGRQTVHTYLRPWEDRPKWWDFVRRKLVEGRQAYVITPLVDESEKIPTASLEESYEALANGELEAFRLGLVHGRMSPEEKEQAMAAFVRGDTQVLVATSVVEVGVDVPNATLMTIEGAERFGLAQLHQLRGRISRGAYPGYCCLFARLETPQSRQRLEALSGTTDGFRLAEIDFELRGPGDLLGTKQHGLPPLRIADLRRDRVVLEEARRDARTLVAADPGLRHPDHARLRRMALVRYGQALDLADVG